MMVTGCVLVHCDCISSPHCLGKGLHLAHRLPQRYWEGTGIPTSILSGVICDAASEDVPQVCSLLARLFLCNRVPQPGYVTEEEIYFL